MQESEHVIREFFEAYARRFNDSLGENPEIDVQGVQDSFAKYFVESSPVGVHGGKNGTLFKMMIPRGFKRYRDLGTQSMKIASLDLTQLDEYHWMAKVHWDSTYEKKVGASVRIEFDVIYFLTLQSGSPKIFSYITGDEQRVLKDHGLA